MTGRVRQAIEADIPEMMTLRLSVRENRLLDPSQVTAEDCRRYVTRGNMWVWDENGTLLGISAANGDTGWIWALFVRPEHEGRGIGRALYIAACDALIAAGFRTLRLSTDTDTRAARFYRAAGWREAGRTPEGELIFELDVSPT
ncbi:MAG: GNAT family N-acetyltransferase [Rhodospirillum sp.]|nr:GNAT family N-acetyltransferase [Rhodospirillum sp.]